MQWEKHSMCIPPRILNFNDVYFLLLYVLVRLPPLQLNTILFGPYFNLVFSRRKIYCLLFIAYSLLHYKNESYNSSIYWFPFLFSRTVFFFSSPFCFRSHTLQSFLYPFIFSLLYLDRPLILASWTLRNLFKPVVCIT